MKRFLFLLVLASFFCKIGFSQTDTSKTILYSWRLVDDFLVEPVTFDTTLSYYQVFNPVEKYSISNSWLGNFGSPCKSNLFFRNLEGRETDFVFDNLYRPYGFSRENQLYYHSSTPYFDLRWFFGTKKRGDNLVNALYTQNINKKWNVGIRYKLVATKGEYAKSLVSNHSINVFTSYKGEKYSMHAALLRNKYKTDESGGSDTTGTNAPDAVAPFLENASSIYFDRSLTLSQEYKFGFTKKIVINDSTTESTFKELGRINHVFSYDDNYRIYLDSDPILKSTVVDEVSGEEKTVGYYDEIFQSNGQVKMTRDSLRLAKFENSLYWTFKEINKPNFKGRLTIAGTLENLRWTNSMSIPKLDSIDTAKNQFVFSEGKATVYAVNYNNIKLSSSLDARTKMFIFSAKAYYYLGDVLGETNKTNNLGGEVLISKGIMVGKQKSDFYAKLKVSNTSPYIVQDRFESNHYSWQNSFNNINTTTAKVGLKIPALRIGGEFSYGIVDNYIYYDTVAIPQQLPQGELLTVTSVSLNKDFLIGKNKKYGRFYMKNKVVYQLPSIENTNIISLPEWSLYHSFYYSLDYFIDKTFIEAHFGYDVSYNTRYMALGYNPVVGQFYQSKFYTGDFPIVSVFIKARVKTVLLFIKFENMVKMFTPNEPFYFITDKYLMNTTAFKFGASWRFKN